MQGSGLASAWEQAIARLDSENIGPANFAFLNMIKPMGDIEGTILLAVPNDFTKKFVEQQIASQLTNALATELGREEVRIAIDVNPDLERQLYSADQSRSSSSNPQIAQTEGTATTNYVHGSSSPSALVPNMQIKGSPLNPKYTFDSFVIGPSNRFAHAAALAVAEAPARAYNPLFIYGDSGLGKTHLLHSIGHYANRFFPHLRVIYVNSEEFTNEFIDSIQSGKKDAFKRRYRKADILLIDDIQFIQGKKETVEEFFHTFNALHDAGNQIVITSDLPPKLLSGFEDRLRSRFQSGLIADIQPPDLETRIAILQLKAKYEGIEIDRDVLEYIASRISANIRELEGALLRVTAFANLTKQPVDLALAQMVLKDLLTDPDDTEITPSMIMGQTASYFNITIEQLCSPDRSRSIAQARQIAMYLCRELTELSLPKIGEIFGGRDHTTVMYAVNKVTRQMKERREIFNQVDELTARIKREARQSNGSETY